MTNPTDAGLFAELSPDSPASAARALAARWRDGDPTDVKLLGGLRARAGPPAQPVEAPARGLRRRDRRAAARDRGRARAAVRRRRAGRPARGFRLRRVPRRAAGDHRSAAGRPRLHRRDADRRRQVDHLPDPRAHPGRDDAGHLAAGRADEGPGRRDARDRRARDLPVRDAGPRRAPAADARPGGGQVRALLRRAGRHRGVRRPAAAQPGPAPDRRRRGPLHQPVGSRLPSRLPQPRRAEGQARRRPGSGVDRDRDARGDRRHRLAAGDEEPGERARQLLPPQPAPVDVPQGRRRRRRDGRPAARARRRREGRRAPRS